MVLYGGNNNWFSAYAYWYFKVYGHDNVKLMNGGRKKWELEGRELRGEKPAVTATNYRAKEADPSIRALRDEVIAGVGKTPMVDVRSPTSSAASWPPPPTCPRSRPSARATSPAPRTCPGRSRPTRTAPSGRSRS